MSSFIEIFDFDTWQRNGESPAKVPPSPTAGSAPASTVAAQQQQLAQQQAAQVRPLSLPVLLP
jgi:hypothetical protein